jgi:drug/metabolite transporter (DMT)-like permease
MAHQQHGSAKIPAPTRDLWGGAPFGILTVVMTLAGWSSVPLFITYLSKYVDVWTSNGWRYAFSALLWAPVLVAAYWKKSVPPGLWRKALVPSIVNAIGQAAFAWSFYNIDPTTATFGLRMQIVFVAVGAYLMFPSERPVLRSPVSWAGIVLVLCGVLGTIVFRPEGIDTTPVAGRISGAFGVTLAIVGGMFFAAYGLSVRKCMAGFHPVTAFAAISQYTSLVLVVLMLVMARDPVTHVRDFGASAFHLGWTQVWVLLLSSVIGIALGHVFYYISIARLGVAVSGGVIQLQPFCVAILTYFLQGTLLTGGQWLSGTAAVGGAVMLLFMQWQVSRTRANSLAQR